ncbi:MAG TPA: hypothetical protein VL614_10665 [Acetobacteraceae bacterium]|nr:hypothetical protein [Acetobacteraceae bacterium]
MRLPIRGLVLAALLVPGAAMAQSVTPEQATQLRQQLNDWIAGLLGPSVKLPPLPLKVTAAGDHYDLSLPILGLEVPKGDPAMAAELRPLSGGRWSLEKARFPSAGSFTISVPETGAGPSGPMKGSYTVGKQDLQWTIDPSFASPSTSHSVVEALAIAMDGPNRHQEEHIDRMSGEAALTPGKNGRLDVKSEATVEGWKSAALEDNKPAMAFGARRIHMTSQAEGINREHAADLTRAVAGLISAMPNGPEKHDGKADMSPLAKAQLRLMIAAMEDMVSSVSVRESFDDMQIEIAGKGGATVKHLQFGFGGDAPDKTLHAWLDIGFDGVDSPTMPPKLATYLPKHFEIKPTLSGVPTSVLKKLAMDLSEDDPAKHPMGPDVAAIFASGGAVIGLETLSFDLGPATLKGTGDVTVTSPTTWRGQAHVVATGFDELTTEAKGNPDLQQALPVLVMMRGLAKPDGDKLVWDIASEGPKLTVNGMDMSALAGGGKETPRQPGAKPSRQPGAKP